MAKLYFYYSAMNAGKTTILLQSAHNYRERGMTPLLFTPALDDRHKVGVIKSRIGLEAEAVAFERSDDLLAEVQRRLEDQLVAAAGQIQHLQRIIFGNVIEVIGYRAPDILMLVIPQFFQQGKKR